MDNVVPLEAAVVKRIMRLLASRGAWYVKTTGVSKVGCPDILACYKGQFLAIECKSAIGKTSRKQEYELYRIHMAGGRRLIASTVELVQFTLDEIDSHVQGTD